MILPAPICSKYIINHAYLVGVPISGVDSTMLVVKLHGAGDGLGQGEARGHGLGPVQLLPDGLGDILGHQGMLGLDLGERFRHVDGFELLICRGQRTDCWVVAIPVLLCSTDLQLQPMTGERSDYSVAGLDYLKMHYTTMGESVPRSKVERSIFLER